MAQSSRSETHDPSFICPVVGTGGAVSEGALVPTEHWMSRVAILLEELHEAASTDKAPPVVDRQTDSKLVQVRLGVAASLFTALRCKAPPTAAHALRVALSASVWCLHRGLPEKERDGIEIAALLHDVGMIGIPDRILLKPGVLDVDESMVVERARQMSLDILQASCAEPAILEVVGNVPAWYDGSRRGYSLRGERIPLGARMIAILETFDSITTDQVFRPAMSRERAMSELFDHAGRQFDPRLVEEFAAFQHYDQTALRVEVARRWLHDLDPEVVNSYWEFTRIVAPNESPSNANLFQSKLLENMHDAVLFVDGELKIMLWNHGAERLTGIASASVTQRTWTPELLDMHDEKGNPIQPRDCPVAWATRSGVQSLRRLTIRGRSGQSVSVDSHAMPVFADDARMLGAVVLLHDASSEISLEERCQNLAEKAKKDSLTELSNRAEFDRVHAMFVNAHLQQRVPCSLIICDLDHFKQVNDTYGHQAGDEVIKSLSALLKNSCRSGDLVARYGGEEFVVLCADCDNAAAAARAEEVRKAMSKKPQNWMEGRAATASFGVTEIQPGDTAETMLRRADRALLAAKSQGRNRVVQLGTGILDDAAPERKTLWTRKSKAPNFVLERDLLTTVPISVAIEKLRGFVADHQAQIGKIQGNAVQLQIDDTAAGPPRRRGDRPVTFLIDLKFEEVFLKKPGEKQGVSHTKLHASISPKSNRDRRQDDLANRAQEVLLSLRSYLVATEGPPPEAGVLRRVKRILSPWLIR